MNDYVYKLYMNKFCISRVLSITTFLIKLIKITKTNVQTHVIKPAIACVSTEHGILHKDIYT